MLTKQWNLPILFSLLPGAYRFIDVKHAVPLITPKMLSARLLELQDHSLVDKTIITEPELAQLYLLSTTAYKPVRNLAADILSVAI